MMHAWMLVASIGLADRPDLPLARFEARTYGTWRTEGEAFGHGPAAGTLPNQMSVTGYQGIGLVNSFDGGDAATGKLISPDFTLTRHRILFLIGGGGWEKKTCMHLFVDGKIVRSATGPNRESGGSEELLPAQWDVRDLEGMTGRIEIIDDATGGWGHINVDEIVLSDNDPPAPPGPAERELLVDEPYLLLPIKDNHPRRKLTISAEGGPTLSLDIELADERPDWWAFISAEPWMRKKVLLRIDRMAAGAPGLGMIRSANSIPHREELYQESRRPQFHFSSQRGWNNDPNGLSFFKGEYHLFYQHNPVGWNWGNMHWGHAVSKDLVHWQEVGDALMPDEQGAMFSGSAVVDFKNSSGLSRGESPAQILLYTAWGQPQRQDIQSLAYSLDGRSYIKLPQNPVVKQITAGNRDPKVFWHEPSQQWVMALYVEQPKGRHTIQFLHSSDLKNWSQGSHAEGFFECPDLFELALDGDPSRKKWILTAADSGHKVGSFDGKTFTPETEKLTGHRGRGFYAAQTFSDLPNEDGRRVQIGWLQAPSPGMPFNQAMSLPMELRLVSTADGPRMTWNPVRELERLRTGQAQLERQLIRPSSNNPFDNWKLDLFELRLRIRPMNGPRITLDVRGAKLVLDVEKKEIVFLDHHLAWPGSHDEINLTIFGDRTSLEVFTDEGKTYIPMPFLADPKNQSLAIHVNEGEIELMESVLHHLSSSWTNDHSSP
ncbi:glycoside hydrolase family 32 protein [bacterium]|nr:glycoside hydrolase family 32 protein [bacterium]